ncbi:MAG: hypothetical protein II135_01385 [Clostridia bacterium]|nr:hypothetical protein [Clostridia bacterium]
MIKKIALLALIVFTLAAALLSCMTAEKPEEMKAEGLSKTEFLEIVSQCEKYGKKFDDLLMEETAAYFYGFAGASVSAMRLAVEKILWLRGEGDDFDSLTEGSRYKDWNTIAEICYASPYPYYFEGMIHEMQGESDAARSCYVNAAMMYNYPEKGLDFYYLKNAPISELYDLRGELCGYEDRIYGEYRPTLYGYERTPYNSSPEYLCADATELLDAGRYDEAMIPAVYAVRIRPTEPECWICAITAASYANEAYKATKWLEEALRYNPDHEGLKALASSFADINEQSGGEE